MNITHISFIKQCMKICIIPTFAKVSHSLKNNRNNQLFRKMDLMLVRDQIRSLHLSLERLYRKILKLHIQLENLIDNTTWDYWDRCLIGRAEMVYRRLKIKNNAKLIKL